jgi:hypothetical protein
MAQLAGFYSERCKHRIGQDPALERKNKLDWLLSNVMNPLHASAHPPRMVLR